MKIPENDGLDWGMDWVDSWIGLNDNLRTGFWTVNNYAHSVFEERSVRVYSSQIIAPSLVGVLL